MSSSTSQVALLNNHHSSLFADHQEQICSNMAFFSNFPSSTLLSSPALKSSGHDNFISAALLPADHLSSSSSSSVSTETLLSSSTATVAPLREVTPVNGPGTQHILSLHANGATPASANNYWAWGELNQGLLMSNKLMRGGDAAVDVGDRDHLHQQRHTSNSSSSLLGMSAMKMKKIKGRRKVRDPRFCFKTLSDVDVLDDGYKWRKYGQKVVKNTQHPRSYYRCTQDNCRVKKRVERLAEDPRMVITTYEGRHMHSPSQDTEDSQAASNSYLSNDFFW